MKPRRRSQMLVIASMGAALVACATGCVEASVHEKTARDLDAATRAGQYKDQQIHVLEWQVASMAHALREAQAREVALGDVGRKLADANQAYAACEDRRRRDEGERQELAASLAAAENAARGGARGRPDDVRRLVATLEAQNARILERLGRLEQKLDRRSEARAAEDARHPAKPDRTIDAEIVDPWGFGARK